MEHLLLGAPQDGGLAGHLQDEVEQAQLARFPDLPQLLKGLLGLNVLIFIPPDLQELGLRNQDWARAQGTALEQGPGSGECRLQRPSGFGDGPSAAHSDLGCCLETHYVARLQLVLMLFWGRVSVGGHLPSCVPTTLGLPPTSFPWWGGECILSVSESLNHPSDPHML